MRFCRPATFFMRLLVCLEALSSHWLSLLSDTTRKRADESRNADQLAALRSLKGVGAQSPFWLMWAAHFFVEPVRMGDTVWFSPQMFVQ